MLGTWIKAEREGRGWTQSELARRVGVSSAYIHQIEAGKRRKLGASIAQQLAAVLGVTIEQLLQADAPALPAPLAELQDAGIPDTLMQELLSVWGHLTPEDQRVGVAVLRSLWESRNEQDRAR